MLAASLAYGQGSSTIHSKYTDTELELTIDPDSAAWSNIPGVVMTNDPKGRYVADNSTEMRSRWSKQNLYVLFICHYDELNPRAVRDRSKETKRLYENDVAQVFIAPGAEPVTHYFEFEISPNGEFADARWETGKPNTGAFDWNSSFKVKTKIDEQRQIWYAAVQIPVAALAQKAPEKGQEMRVNFARTFGPSTVRRYLSWQKMDGETLHKPALFGKIVLEE